MAENPERDELSHDEFYTGYLPEAPVGIARHNRKAVLLVLLITACLAAALAASQKPFAVSFFEFGAPRSFEGVITFDPHPVLEVERPGGGTSRYYLVAFGKSGADEAVAELDGHRVRLEGTLIHRDDQTMLELLDGTVEDLGPGTPATPAEALGERTLRGEIVDSKCYLGVMKPGREKTHRACASLCIRGGIPPLFLVDTADGASSHFLLVDAQGRAVNGRILDKIAEPLEITGQVERVGDHYVLKADPETYRRLL